MSIFIAMKGEGLKEKCVLCLSTLVLNTGRILAASEDYTRVYSVYG